MSLTRWPKETHERMTRAANEAETEFRGWRAYSVDDGMGSDGLLPSKEGVKDNTGIRYLVVRQGIGLENAASVGVRDIGAGTVCRAPGVFVTLDVERWVFT